MPTIQELAKTVQFRGTPQHRIAEPSSVKTLPVIDNSLPQQSNMTTSVDCYVAGQYVQRTGKVIEVTQRYTIFVSYAKGTQLQTMNQVRDRIISDFQERYGRTFNVTNVFVPQIPVPIEKEVEGVPKGKVGDIEFYEGSGMFRSMTAYEKMRFETGTQREIARTNIESIKQRYGYKR